jgi:hypothetical protein
VDSLFPDAADVVALPPKNNPDTSHKSSDRKLASGDNVSGKKPIARSNESAS